MTSQPDRLSKPTKKERAAARAQRAAELKAEQERRERRRRILSIGGVAAGLIVLVGVVVWLQSGDDSPTPTATSEYGYVQGPDDAPRSLVVYEDFLCPFCGDVERTIGDQLDELAAEGEVQVDYRPISILGRVDDYSEYSLNAFLVVRDASTPEVTDAFHDLLFANQPPEEGPFPSREDLLALAVEAGADEAAISAGILEDAQSDAVGAATDEAADAGVSGTPTLVLDGEVFDEGRTIEEIGSNLLYELRQPVADEG